MSPCGGVSGVPAYSMLTTLSATSPDLEALLALNNEYAKELAYTDQTHFNWLVEHAFFAASIDRTESFLIAFDQDSDYTSPNFLWFKQRFPKFIYVDRLATAARARGQGHAITLYDALFSAARAAGQKLIVCEINELPPNPVSVALHARFGFIKVGEAEVQALSKTVGYYVKNFQTE